MDKILVILTGGTIGSKSENGTVDVNSAAAYSIIERYYNKFGRNTDFDVVNPVNILSENITSQIWLDLCKCIDNADLSKYKGIIICHGSDTLTYTSNIIGMLYNKLNIPVVLVAANYELSNEMSNGIINFRSGVLIIEKGIRGVFVAYSNDKNENDIYIATRIVEAEPYNDQYRSFEGKPWGRIIDNEIYVNTQPSIKELKEYKAVITKRPENFNNKVLLIRPYPDMDYSSINIEGFKAVVHYMYHSATACVEGKETSIINFAKRCKKQGVKLYLAPFKDINIKRAYASSREILDEGIIPLFNISPEAAYIKVLIAENMEGVKVTDNIYFESL